METANKYRIVKYFDRSCKPSTFYHIERLHINGNEQKWRECGHYEDCYRSKETYFMADYFESIADARNAIKDKLEPVQPEVIEEIG